MPADCNALELAPNSKIFSKETCQWTFKAKGRKGSSTKKAKTSAKTKAVCLVLDINQYDLIKEKAIQESKRTGKSKSMTMVIRESLRKSFPFLEQKDMFDNERLG
jgi:hypothetical protein